MPWPPRCVARALEAIRIARSAEGDALRARLFDNAARFRAGMTKAGFDLVPGEHPIIPVMLGDARLAQDLSAVLLEEGLYVIGFSFPVVPHGAARIRVQLSAAHSTAHVDRAIAAFVRGRDRLLGQSCHEALAKTRAAPGLEMIEAERPVPGPDQVLIRVRRTAICGTDLHIWKWDEWAQKTIPVPMIVGHEFSGEIAEIGSAVTRPLKLGQLVAGEGHIIDPNSAAARVGQPHLDPGTRGIGVNIQGAFAEYLCLPAYNVIPLPEGVTSGDRGAARSLRQCCSHRPAIRTAGRGCADYRRGAHWHYGGDGGAGRRRASVILTDRNDWRLALA